VANDAIEPAAPGSGWKSPQVLAMAGICLVLGLLLGYIFRDSGSPNPQQRTQPAAMPSSAVQTRTMPTLDDMRHMAEKQAAAVQERLKTDPKNSRLWNQLGTIYKTAHQFKEAAGYYEKALQFDPKNVAARTDLASCLYYQGDVDGALRELHQSLQYAPKDANSLFNLGMIRWQAKQDAQGAEAAWEQLLKSNPELTAVQRAEVEKLIAQVKQHSAANQLPVTK
jgi:cytochrome c-type biogenesis protein CcmH/NrfG